MGDNALDMEAARRAGCRGVLLGFAEHDGGLAAITRDGDYPDAEMMRSALLGLALAARLG